ncbi:MAG TPA: hypothetical protein VG710_04795 [Opitutus sp.]|nr:hypothetical protein [Opitutus sp.]
MKIKLPFFAAVLFASAAALSGAPLTATTAVHTKPDDAAPVVSILKAGTEPVAVPDSAAAPTGWMAVGLPGPFQAYVKNGDILKDLEVRPGAQIYLEPKEGAGALATMEAGDKVKITGLLGRWTQISLDKKLTGYIRTGATPANEAAVPSGSAVTSPPAESRGNPTNPPAAPSANSTADGKPVPVVDAGGAMPRPFEGKLVSTRSPFHPRRPFDWALVDDTGKRIAYLDVSKLLLTEQIDSYVGHTVVIYGAPKAINSGKDLVIDAENLRLK